MHKLGVGDSPIYVGVTSPAGSGQLVHRGDGAGRGAYARRESAAAMSLTRAHVDANFAELLALTDSGLAVRFECEWHDANGQWWCSYGNENWEFTPEG